MAHPSFAYLPSEIEKSINARLEHNKSQAKLTRRERWAREDLTREEIESENKELHQANERLTEMLISERERKNK